MCNQARIGVVTTSKIFRRLEDNPRFYDLVQTAAGYPILARRLKGMLGETAGLSVLDAGAGTGAVANLVGDAATYTALEIDPIKIHRLRLRQPLARVIEGSVTAIPLQENAVDVAVIVNVCHHLDDSELETALGELARVATSRIMLVDPVRDGPLLGRALWRIDRGAYPRTAYELLDALNRHSTVTASERLTIFHRYILASAALP
jgi:ubiquinone/menaquinone biosynthesis C-methylase UbiE